MRIAVWHNLPSGGAKRALQKDIRGFVDRGCEVEVWCPPTANLDFAPLGRMATEHIVPLDQYEAGAGPLTPTEVLRDSRRDIDAMDRHCSQCASQIDRGSFDLLYANACMFYRVTSIGRQVHIPSVLYLPEPYRPLYEAMPESSWAAPTKPPAWWRSRFQIRQAAADILRIQSLRIQVREEICNAQAYDRILVNSHYSRESVWKAYGCDSRVCYPGVDVDRWRPSGADRKPFILGMGAVVWEKNINFVLDSIAARQGPPVPLVWIGNVAVAELLDRLRDQAQRLAIDFRPEIGISDDDLIDHLNRAGVLVHAPRLEPMGLAPLEAGACELPVVAVAEAGVREMVRDGETGYLVEHEPRAVAAGLDAVLADHALAARMGAAGRRWVTTEWTLGAAADRLQHHLDQVLAARS